MMHIFFDRVEKHSNLWQKNTGGLAKLCFMRNCAINIVNRSGNYFA